MNRSSSPKSTSNQKGNQRQRWIEHLSVGVFLLVASLSQSWHFLSGAWFKGDGIHIPMLHDTLWHFAVIHELARSFPPQNPGMAGVPLLNYHFLSDLILMLVHQGSGLSVETVYMYLAPPVVAFLFALSAFMLAKRLTKSTWKGLTGAAFTVFGGSAAYTIPLLLGKNTPWFANSFMLDQPFDQLTNVHTVLGFSIFLFGVSILHRFVQDGRKNDAIFSGLLLGLSTAVKAYAGIVAVGALWTALVPELVLRRSRKMLLPTLIATGLFLGFTLWTSSTTKPPLLFLPGWILRRMVEDSGRFYNEHLTQLYQHYTAAGNIPRFIQINLEEFGLYLVGNLGVRILAFICIGKKILRFSRASTMDFFLIGAVVFSLGIPLLFVQPVSVYNTIQFSPYALMLLSILLVVEITEKKPHTALLILLFILSIPTTIKTFILANQEESVTVPIKEVEAMQFVNTLPEESVVLTPISSQHRYLMKIPGLGGRRTYFSGETFAVLTDTPYQYRLEAVEEFFSPETPVDRRERILKDAKITHIYSDSKGDTAMLEELEKDGFPISKIFSNAMSTIFVVR